MGYVISKDGKAFLRTKGLTQKCIETIEVSLNHDSIKDMAEDLGLTQTGVKWHLSAAYKALKVKKTGLIMILMPFVRWEK